MKNKSIIMIMALLITLFATSCDNDKSTSANNQQYNDFSDLNIPDNFNFETNQVVNLKFYAPNIGTVAVVGDDGVEYYRFLTNDQEAIERTISIPKAVTSLNFHYRNMVFSDYLVTDLMNESEVFLYNIEEVEEKSASKKVKLYVIPILEGIELEDDGSITSHWGYNNEYDEVYIQNIGAKNKFTGSGLNNSNQDQGQPTEFLPGRQYNVFTVNFTSIGNDCITWSLQISSRLTQDACADAPLFPGIDEDNDGVVDEDDDYSNDPNKAYDLVYPGDNTYGTLAYEDLWPDKGDYDFNDMVIRYNIKEVVSSVNELKEIHFNLLLTAIGATKQNGFYFELPIQAEDITLLSASHPLLTQKTNSSGLAIIQVFHNTNDLVQLNGNFMNTVPTMAHTPFLPISFVVEVNGEYPASESEFFIPYNPYITINHDPSMEVHLPGLPPTSNADQSYFNNGFDDATDLEAGYYYKTAEGAPWAIHTPATMAHPTETTDIVESYPDFGNWVNSNGASNREWYRNGNHGLIYNGPGE